MLLKVWVLSNCLSCLMLGFTKGGIHAAVVTVEPYPDFDPAPYAIKILKKDIAQGTQGMSPLALEPIMGGAPTGTAKVQ